VLSCNIRSLGTIGQLMELNHSTLGRILILWTELSEHTLATSNRPIGGVVHSSVILEQSLESGNSPIIRLGKIRPVQLQRFMKTVARTEPWEWEQENQGLVEVIRMDELIHQFARNGHVVLLGIGWGSPYEIGVMDLNIIRTNLHLLPCLVATITMRSELWFRITCGLFKPLFPKI